MKSMQIWSFFWSVFSRIQFECGEMRTRITSNTDNFTQSNCLIKAFTENRSVGNLKRNCKTICQSAGHFKYFSKNGGHAYLMHFV